MGDRYDTTIVSDGSPSPISSLLGLPGRLVAVTYRGEQVALLAEIDHEATAERPDGPLTDLLHLELLTGWDEAPWWRPAGAAARGVRVPTDPDDRSGAGIPVGLLRHEHRGRAASG